MGKTTLARIIANQTKANFVNLSATSSGVKEVRSVMTDAAEKRDYGINTILFIDEIHRFNKSQQDALLPSVEDGSITLIGATTENPSFEVNYALLSRCKVFVLRSLTADDIKELITKALGYFREYTPTVIEIEDEYINIIANYSNGDARTALNILEIAITNSDFNGNTARVTKDIIEQCTGRKVLPYDKAGDEHFNLISALHKSMRNSDVQASVYWLVRMLEAGEDPLYIARRVTRFASEDIGMADSSALAVCIDAYQACHYIGMPECGVHLTHAVTYCALACKSNAVYMAYNEAKQDVQDMPLEPVPLTIRNAPTQLMKDLDYGAGYQYAHDLKNGIADMECLPDKLRGRKYYRPTDRGKETRIREWMQKLDDWRKGK